MSLPEEVLRGGDLVLDEPVDLAQQVARTDHQVCNDLAQEYKNIFLVIQLFFMLIFVFLMIEKVGARYILFYKVTKRLF